MAGPLRDRLRALSEDDISRLPERKRELVTRYRSGRVSLNTLGVEYQISGERVRQLCLDAIVWLGRSRPRRKQPVPPGWLTIDDFRNMAESADKVRSLGSALYGMLLREKLVNFQEIPQSIYPVQIEEASFKAFLRKLPQDLGYYRNVGGKTLELIGWLAAKEKGRGRKHL